VAQDLPLDEINVVDSRSEVFVLGRGEPIPDFGERLHKRPFGDETSALYAGDCPVEDRSVRQHGDVGIEDGQRLAFQLVLEGGSRLFQLVAGDLSGPADAGDLLWDLFAVADRLSRHGGWSAQDQNCTSDHNTG
jgi:hypothetical protein